MNHINSILNALIPVLSCPVPLEMDYFTKCCHIFYISFHTICIVRKNVLIFRRPMLYFPLVNSTVRCIFHIFSVIKRPKKILGTSKMEPKPLSQNILEIMNGKQPGETSLKYSSKKLKLFSEGEKEVITTSELNLHNESSTEESTNAKRKKKTKMEMDIMKKEMIPNYFLAVSISDPQICSSVEEIQKNLIIQDERLKKVMLPLNDLHVTIMVMNLKDDETYNRAIKALQRANEKVKHEMIKNPLLLEFCGIGHFGHRVIYAKLCPNESYDRFLNLTECLKMHLAEENILSTDKKDVFMPHLTMGKVRFCRKNYKEIKKVNPVFYESFKDQYFGSQIITGFILFKMIGKKDPVTGCRIGDEFLFERD